MIKKAKVRQAVEVIRELNLKFLKDSSKKKNLLESDNGGSLFLQITLKKIPTIKNVKMIKIPLPNSLPSDDACLITGDLDKKNHKADIEPDILYYKEVLRNCGVTGLSEVITLRQLRTDYKSYEAKQLLSAAFDTFLADKKIAGTLPKVLGKHFFRKRKFPVQIDLKSEDLKRDIEYALSEKVLFLSGHGNSCTLEIAHLDMDESKIIENVLAAVNTLSEKLPGSMDNVMGLYLKLARSKAIPIYISYDGASNVKFDAEKEASIIENELSTLPNASVRVYSDGRVECTRKLQNGETEDLEDDVSSAEEEEPQKLRKKKKKSEKNSLPECDQLNEDVVKCEIDENVSCQGDSLVIPSEKNRKRKKSKKETTSMKNARNTPNDSEDSQAAELPSETKKIKKSKRESTNERDIQVSPDDSEDSQTVNSAIETKKLKKNKKQITSVKQLELFSNQSGDSQTVNPTIETKKVKKNKKQITSVKQAELFSNQLEDSQVVKSPIQTKKVKSSKSQAKNLECAELSISHDSEDSTSRNLVSKSRKRKRADSESVLAEQIKEKVFQFKSPNQAKKRERLEDVKDNLAGKKARRNKMKENRLKSK